MTYLHRALRQREDNQDAIRRLQSELANAQDDLRMTNAWVIDELVKVRQQHMTEKRRNIINNYVICTYVEA